jgi:hypothetical protein
MNKNEEKNLNTGEIIGNALIKSILETIPSMRPLILLIIFAILSKLIPLILEQKRFAKLGIDEIDKMDGRTFERY